MEVKNYTEKYKEKLVIKPLYKQTVVDRLDGNNEHFKKKDNIDFDF